MATSLLRLFQVLCATFCINFGIISTLITFRNVHQCPMDKSSWNSKKESLHCIEASLTYHCMKKVGGGFAEFCGQSEGKSTTDGCPMLHERRGEIKMIQVPCRKSSIGCPNITADGDYFTSDELYKFPACLENQRRRYFTRDGSTIAKKADESSLVIETEGKDNLAITGGVVTAVIIIVILVASLCGLMKYIKGLRQSAQAARYVDVPFQSLAVGNFHHYTDPRTYDYGWGLESRDQCRGAEGGASERDYIDMMVPDDSYRVSCARNSLYDYINDREVKEDVVESE